VASIIPPQEETAGFTTGHRISGYRLEQEIGRGGMAVVFSAYDERLERQVALKILAPALARDKVFRQRFIAESRAAAAVDDPHIIPVYEAGESDGVLFIAMRLVRGGDLRTLVAQHGPLESDRAGWILSAVASALDAAHAAGLVHRDVKPANLLLDVRAGRPDHVYLSDFGLTKAVGTSGGLTSGGQFTGTADYAAPEQIVGLRVDGRTDQYALGCTTFELLCGHPPFSGRQWPSPTYAPLSAAPPAATSERPDLPAAVDGVFARVLAKSPADRYGCCQDFAAALRTALGLKAYVSEVPAAPIQSQLGQDHRGQKRPNAGTGGDVTLPLVAAGLDRFTDMITRPAGAEAGATSQMTGGPTPATRFWRPGRVLVSAGIAVVLLMGAGAAVWFGRAHAARPAQAASYQFQTFYPNAPDRRGLAISQRWTLAGSGGSRLEVSMAVRNLAASLVDARLIEPLPKSAGALSNFGGVRPQIMAHRIVWDLALPSDGKDVVLTYQAPEQPAGASKHELLAYVRAYSKVYSQQLLIGEPPPGALQKVWIRPHHKFLLRVNQPRQLYALGRLSDHQPASAADLLGAVWSTSPKGIVTVDGITGVVTGLRPGTAMVSVNIDGVTAEVTVVVVAIRGGSSANP
jgi:Protein kinase domain